MQGIRSMAWLGIRLLTWWKGETVGTDEFGNRYYQERGKQYRAGRRRRWVVYDGQVEASRVPPEWHAWLHYTIDDGREADRPRRPWQKPPQPNMTGTALAYRPAGPEYHGGTRACEPGDYEA